MATPRQHLAESLAALKALQDQGVVAIRSRDLTRAHRERLIRTGFLREVMKGWYIAANPGDEPGDSTVWYATFWDFCTAYLAGRFGDAWCLSSEQSLALHAGNRTVPSQLIVRAPKGGNKPIELPYGTSILDLRAGLPPPRDMTDLDGLRVHTRAAALVEAPRSVYANRATDVRTVLSLFQDASDILERLLEEGRTVIAGRLAGAFRNLGRDPIADDIVATMEAAGYSVRESDPFEHPLALMLPRRETSPYAGRIRLMWHAMRGAVAAQMPPVPGPIEDVQGYLHRLDDAYTSDAYHSLSIEGYRVSPELIERVRGGDWDPDGDARDREHRDALAARGYFQAFQAVKQSVAAILRGENPGRIAERDHAGWFRELFAPSVAAGLIRPSDLAGYRSAPVFIRQSMHVPPRPEAVRDTMPVLFEQLEAEEDAAVRTVLGHFVFVYIHPYLDGNGRLGRFLMNVMLASGGYPWTIIPATRRADYMSALEDASVRENVVPLARFIGELVAQTSLDRGTARGRDD